MAQVTHSVGQLKKFQANITFGLNFEDNRNSIKVTQGDTLEFDGLNAIYLKNNTEYSGRAPSLKSAIEGDWLFPVGTEQAPEPSQLPQETAQPEMTDPTYDPKKGGSFDGFMEQENKMEVVHENDQIVKTVEVNKESRTAAKSDKLEVAGDQVAVKENVQDLVVASTTAVPRTKPHATQVSQADHYGADRTIPLKMASEKEKKSADKQKTFIVDSSTPNLPEDATQSEVERATGTKQVEGETQEATVVKKIGDKTPVKKQVEPQEATVVRRIGESEPVQIAEGIILNKTKSPKEMSINTQVGATGEMQTAAEKEAAERKKEAEKRAAENAKKRKAALKDNKTTTKRKSSKKIASKKKAPKSIPKPKAEVKLEDGTVDYLAMMPDEWSKMHWVQKEKFIFSIDDPDFVKFIARVETVKAVQAACKKRLETIGQKSN